MSLLTHLDWLDDARETMLSLTERWAAINSGSENLAGLRAMRAELSAAFQELGAAEAVIPLAPLTRINAQGVAETVPMAEALRLTKRPEAPFQVLLVGHMDTVYGPDHPFQTTQRLADGLLRGPGVADLKGGLVVMLYALKALERSPYARTIGWQVVLNPDEEIGSVASDPVLKEAAVGKHIGLVYEPSLLNGTLAGARKGSGNFTLVVRGRAAHAGRNPEAGRNAIVALAEATAALFALNGQRPGLTLNPGRVEGGGALNVVPDLAILRFNVRTQTLEDETWLLQALDKIVDNVQNKDGYHAEVHGQFTRKPKPIVAATESLFMQVQSAAAMLGLTLPVAPSGGCCDGNNLWHYGVPNVDTLGVRGAYIHSDQEVMAVDSLVERAKLSALLLMKLAQKG